MNLELFISRVLDDEGLTAGLDEAAAQALVAALVKRVEAIVEATASEAAAWKQVEALCKRGRIARKLLSALSQDHDDVAAAALARAEGLPWPLAPSQKNDTEAILKHILDHH